LFFLTQQDPNFRIKGSRDPLGFQTIWQSLGRNVIKHLSTVSSNIKDFQVLSYAWYFYGDRDPKYFLSFFYKFEQACGFARGKYISGDAFNGIDFVRKNLTQESLSFSSRNQDTLLSNQKSYGIFGKYNRPFSEMMIKEHESFNDVMGKSLIEKVDFDDLQFKVNRLLSEDISVMSLEDIEVFAVMLQTLTQEEKDFYKKIILQLDGNHVQTELFELINDHQDLIEFTSFNLFSFIDAVLAKGVSLKLEKYLFEIQQSEHVLLPYLYLFKTIQSSSEWKEDRLVTEQIFSSFPKSLNHEFTNQVIRNLSTELTKSPFEIAVAAVNRNKEVSDRRGNAAWIKIENDKLIVCYSDGARNISSFDKDVDFEHNYFLPTFISMYRQIMN